MTRTAARRDSQSHAARIELNAFLGAAYETGVAVSPAVARRARESATHVNRVCVLARPRRCLEPVGPMIGRGWEFWIDRGGTFTDVVARTPSASSGR